MKRYVNECVELRVVARTNYRAGRESECVGKGEREYGAEVGGYTREM